MTMGPHKFLPMPSPGRGQTCVKCGRADCHSYHGASGNHQVENGHCTRCNVAITPKVVA